MPALIAGKAAPEVLLSDIRGKPFSLRDALQHGPVVLAFFKVSCPVCQYAMPFLERIYRAHQGKAQIVAVSQHPKKETQLFLRECGISMPVLLDDPEHYPASNAYHLTNVPTVFLIAPGGEIEVSSVGWDRKDIEKINRRVAQEVSLPVPALFHRGESIMDSKPG
jgi:peroxiredoxin